MLSNSYDELYHADGNNGYDALNRLPEFQREALSDGYGSDGIPDTVTTASRTQVYTHDAQGNFDAVNTNGTSVSRTDNAQNEITVVGSNNLTYDSNGNLTTDETGKQPVWDAWNRLVKVKDSGGATIITYTVDALGRRVRENAGSDRDFFFTAAWQVIEERTGSGNGTARMQYVWSAQYIDALLERKRDTDSNGSLDEALYPTWDANYNVTAAANSSGAVQERFATDPYGGSIIYLDGNWNTLGSSSYAWVYLHQGRPYEALTGLYDSRFRQYSPTLFVWIGMDPIPFADGTNAYGAYGNSPGNAVDPWGLSWSATGVVGDAAAAKALHDRIAADARRLLSPPWSLSPWHHRVGDGRIFLRPEDIDTIKRLLATPEVQNNPHYRDLLQALVSGTDMPRAIRGNHPDKIEVAKQGIVTLVGTWVPGDAPTPGHALVPVAGPLQQAANCQVRGETGLAAIYYVIAVSEVALIGSIIARPSSPSQHQLPPINRDPETGLQMWIESGQHHIVMDKHGYVWVIE